MNDKSFSKERITNESRKMCRRIDDLEQSEIFSKRVKEELRKSKDYLDNIIESSLDEIVVIDSTGCITKCNKAFLKLLGYKKEEVIGKNHTAFAPADFGIYESTAGDLVKIDQIFFNEVEKMISKLLEKGRISGWESYPMRKDKKVVPIEQNIALLYDKEKNVIGAVCISRDITERKRIERALRKAKDELETRVRERTSDLKETNRHLRQEIVERKKTEKMLIKYQQQLRSLASELSLTAERERRKIADELHNRIGHALAFFKIKLGSLRESLSTTKFSSTVDEMRDLIEQTIQDARSLIFELSPHFLYELGFVRAVEWLAEQIQERHNILINFKDDAQPKTLVDDVAILLFQAVHELLINVVKHAQAKSVAVSIRRDGNNMQINIEDDGIGFDIPQVNIPVNRAIGFGLFSIRERLNYLGGHFNIKSKPGGGTRATLVAPLRHKGRRPKVK